MGWVPCTTWWWLEDDRYLGRIALRHRLTERLLREGGHIGYDVRPTARGRGHATAMLHAVLPEAAALGISSALVTCDVDNVASAVIQANGGVLEERARWQAALLGTDRVVLAELYVRSIEGADLNQ